MNMSSIERRIDFDANENNIIAYRTFNSKTGGIVVGFFYQFYKSLSFRKLFISIINTL